MAMIEFSDGVSRDVEIHRDESGDWEALYLDGVLHSQGHSVIETLLGLLGLEVILSNAFLRGGNGGGDNRTAPTTADLEQWRSERAEALEHARWLRDRANGQIAEASQIEARWR